MWRYLLYLLVFSKWQMRRFKQFGLCTMLCKTFRWITLSSTAKLPSARTREKGRWL
jgi:hypothetical protein